jgi:hypothetical protein
MQTADKRPATLVSFIAMLACCIAAAFPLSTPGFAQGSIGGSIGKQGKSVSGGEETTTLPAKRRDPPARTATENPPEKKVSGCGNFFGTWTSGGGSWLFGENDTTISADGTARHLSGIVGNWTCSSGVVVLVWKNWATDKIKLSADGKRLDSVEGGKGFSR